MDRNDVYLQGTIGQDYKARRSALGSEYITFSLIVERPYRPYNDKEKAFEDRIYVRVMAFNKKHVSYLKNVGAKPGQRATIFGSVNSHRHETNGQVLMLNTIIVRDITISKTAKEENKVKEKKDGELQG